MKKVLIAFAIIAMFAITACTNSEVATEIIDSVDTVNIIDTITDTIVL